MGCSPISAHSPTALAELNNNAVSSEEREAAELSQAINSLVINLGTLTTEQIAGMMATCMYSTLHDRTHPQIA